MTTTYSGTHVRIDPPSGPAGRRSIGPELVDAVGRLEGIESVRLVTLT